MTDLGQLLPAAKIPVHMQEKRVLVCLIVAAKIKRGNAKNNYKIKQNLNVSKDNSLYKIIHSQKEREVFGGWGLYDNSCIKN